MGFDSRIAQDSFPGIPGFNPETNFPLQRFNLGVQSLCLLLRKS